jgi:4-azaleucine resistance transporter AzlC
VTTRDPRAELVEGFRAVAPMLVAVIPFGLVAGVTPVARGLGAAAAAGLSLVVFAGSSQLAITDVLGDGGSVLVAVIAALTINLRMLLYSASLAPYAAAMPMRHRLAAAYLLTDQAFAVSAARWSDRRHVEPSVWFFVGAGGLLWAVWQVATVVGALLGSTLPSSVPLDFAVPLVFLVLLVPAIRTRPAAGAAAGGGAAAVVAAQAGAGSLSVLVGALVGIGAGVLVELTAERRGAGVAP